MLKNRSIDGITTGITYTRGNDWLYDDGVGHTDYLEFDDASLGKTVFDIIEKESANSNSAKEWDFYFYKQSGGELSSSGKTDFMAHNERRHTSENVKGWHHFHPNNTDYSWFPSFSDQEHSREMGIPSYLHNNGEVRRFDALVRSRKLNPTEYGRIFGLCH